MKQLYDILVLGATALAAGVIAANRKKSVVVLEPTSAIAGEFGDAWKSDNAANYTPRTREARCLRDEFVRRKAMTETGEWLPAVRPILAGVLENSGADVYFFAALKELAADKEGYSVTFSAFGTNHRFRARTVIDTTSRFVSRAFLGGDAPAARVTLNHVDTDLSVHETPCAAITEGRALITERYDRILKIASELAVTPAETRRDFGAAAWIPSAARGNFLAAFDDGAALALPAGKAFTVVPETVFCGEYDVIVAGLGTAGAVAVVTALEEGLRVLGLENLSAGGGAGTAGNVLWPYFGFKGGVYQELDRRAHLLDDRFVHTGGTGADQKMTAIDASLAGSDFRYGACFTDVLKEGDRVVGAAFMEDSIRREARAKYVIDATADSAVCISAGCPMIGGRESDGHFQTYSSMYFNLTPSGLFGGYVDNGRVNQYDPDDFGKAIVSASASYVHLRDDYSKKNYLGTAPLIGLREGLRIAGEETVDFPSLIAGHGPLKPLYYGWSNLDNHGKDNVLESRIYQDWNTLCDMWGWNVPLPVPAGALIPKGVYGILAAGRNVSVDHDIALGLRMKDDVQKSGEAAARLAAAAIRAGVDVREADTDALREKLFASGCLKAQDEEVRIEKQHYNEVHAFPLWCDDDGAIAEGLSGDTPGYYMWSARTLNKRGLLTALLDSADEKTRINAAMTLTMLDDRSEKVVKILCECALKRDGYIAKPETIPPHTMVCSMPRSIAAISALARIAPENAVETLYTIMEDDSFIGELPFVPYNLLVDREDYYFQYRSHIVAALTAIAKAHPARKAEIRAKLLAYLEGKTLTVTMYMGPVIRFDDTAALRRMAEEL